MLELLNYYKDNEIIVIRFLKNLKQLYIDTKKSNFYAYRLSSSTIDKSYKILNRPYCIEKWDEEKMDWIIINKFINYA